MAVHFLYFFYIHFVENGSVRPMQKGRGRRTFARIAIVTTNDLFHRPFAHNYYIKIKKKNSFKI